MDGARMFTANQKALQPTVVAEKQTGNPQLEA
jgi:hypothetical protein